MKPCVVWKMPRAGGRGEAPFLAMAPWSWQETLLSGPLKEQQRTGSSQ